MTVEYAWGYVTSHPGFYRLSCAPGPGAGLREWICLVHVGPTLECWLGDSLEAVIVKAACSLRGGS